MKRNLALVGCGAISQRFYVPALALLQGELDQIWLVDPSDRALAAASAMLPAQKVHALSEVPGDLDFVIVAVPNALHFRAAMEGLSRGAHLLVEKPFAIWPDEGRELIEAAAGFGRIVSVNQTRRFFPAARELKRRIAAGEFGALEGIVHNEGQKLAWPFESGAAFARDAQRTGVIMDIGVHVIDFYQFVLQPEWTFVVARHDGFRGPEGLARIELRANGSPVRMRLSRYVKHENIAHLSFEKAEISTDVDAVNTYVVDDGSGTIRNVRVESKWKRYDALGEEVLRNFLASGEGRESPVCAASASLPVLELLDEIYRRAELYPAEIGMV